jgi:hypothetical protein
MKAHRNFLAVLITLMTMMLVLAACAAPSRPAAAPAAPAAPAEQAASSPVATPPAAPAAAEALKPTDVPAAAAPTEAPAAPTDATVTADPAGAAMPAIRVTASEPTSIADQVTVTAQVSKALATSEPATPPSTPAVPPAPTIRPLATDTRIPTLAPPAPSATAVRQPAAAPAATETAIPASPTNPPPTAAAPSDTPQPLATATQQPLQIERVAPTSAPPFSQFISVETRVVELEWPPEMRLGESDLVRIALIPSYDGYTVTTEFPGNQTITRPVQVDRPAAYDVFAIGQLVGAGFTIQEEANPKKLLPPGQAVDWRWSIQPNQAGQQRLAITLKLRWEPSAGGGTSDASQPKEADLFSKGLNVNVSSVMGMSMGQAMSTGVMGTLVGAGLALFGLVFRRAPKIKATVAQVINPNANLKIEPHAKITLANDEVSLLQTLFGKYARVGLENEFRSGYSGARTFLAHPIREDGRADAYTIAKIGPRDSMQREFDNYERFVKDTLPPITARIQEPPVTAPALVNRDDKAVLRYTFIGEQGKMPVSLRESLLADPNSNLLNKLFETFGPNWWMQRRPYTFRLAQEYDRMLPAHFVIEPIEVSGGAVQGAKLMDGRKPPGQDSYAVGDMVVLQNFPQAELRADGKSLSLSGHAAPGQPPLRVRWMRQDGGRLSGGAASRFASGAMGKVIGTRETLLRESAEGADLHGLPDPLQHLGARLNESVAGTQSTIHGDLNLENGLVGPGGLIWLIDFAETRDGHALYDFAHLEAEILAHVIAPRVASTGEFVAVLQSEAHPLLNQMHQIAAKCLFNPGAMREYWLALYATCLGATKYANMNAHQRRCLYVAAAYIGLKI